MLTPLFNKCKIEIIDEYAGIQRADGGDNLQKGTLIGFALMVDHLTASTGYRTDGLEGYAEVLDGMVGKTVYWEQYADSGAVIEEDGKRYAFVPFYRLIAVEEQK